MKEMTNYQLKVLAQQKFEQGMGISIPTTKITLLEADTDGSYVFFKVGNCTYSYSRLNNALAVYPNIEGKDGMVIKF